MLSEELENLAAQLAAMRSVPPADLARALRTAEEVARDLAEEAGLLERQAVPAGARMRPGGGLPPGVMDLDAVRRLRLGGAL